MLDTLFLNFCVLCTCGYALSLTYQRWPVERTGRWYVARLAVLASAAVLLMHDPAALPSAVPVDLRAVPLVFALLRSGPLAGMAVAAPLLAVQMLTAGQPPAASFLEGGSSILAMLLVGAALRAGMRRMPPERGRALRLPAAALTLAVNGAAERLLPGGPDSASSGYLPLLLLGLAGYVLLNAIIVNRVNLLKATSRWQSQALLDTLTGLANRRQFDQDLGNLDAGDAILAVDIDHFKRVNDTHGHATGDRVLRAVGQALQTGLRHHDRAYRLGGEEFAVMLRHVNREQAQIVAERLRGAVEASSMAGLKVTISVGVSLVAAGDAPGAVRQADVALYRAKQRGRNRTCAWQSGDLTALDVTKTMIGLI
ncbi:GGDEF domain-containing protein [Deinococcus sp.]|uniref:GGDEF domain-containing protein n=1 Tax=Deinococcus sp. TaxID=47478 RepID=UPI002869E266|nr:GGDEF domain-containing protein [Deinococcus sp.]